MTVAKEPAACHAATAACPPRSRKASPRHARSRRHDPAHAQRVLGLMAISIMGGLVVATALTLVFLPPLYAAWFRVRRDESVPAHAAMPLAVTCSMRAKGYVLDSCSRSSRPAQCPSARCRSGMRPLRGVTAAGLPSATSDCATQ